VGSPVGPRSAARSRRAARRAAPRWARRPGARRAGGRPWAPRPPSRATSLTVLPWPWAARCTAARSVRTTRSARRGPVGRLREDRGARGAWVERRSPTASRTLRSPRGRCAIASARPARGSVNRRHEEGGRRGNAWPGLSGAPSTSCARTARPPMPSASTWWNRPSVVSSRRAVQGRRSRARTAMGVPADGPSRAAPFGVPAVGAAPGAGTSCGCGSGARGEELRARDFATRRPPGAGPMAAGSRSRGEPALTRERAEPQQAAAADRPAKSTPAPPTGPWYRPVTLQPRWPARP
jgi:hypothetical protein